MTCEPKESETRRHPSRVGSCVIIIALCAAALIFVCCPNCFRWLNDSMSPKTFWRKDYDTVVKYHVRDYRVPWSEQLLAAIALAHKHGEQLYLEDTPPTDFARNRGNVKTVNLSDKTLEITDKTLETADCVVICPIMTLDERSGEVVPVRNTCFPFGVTTKHRTEQGDDFSLWYPAVTTDQHGLICLPVYREMTDELAFEAVDADGTRFTVETFGVRDIARPYRFGLYMPVVLSGEQLSLLTNVPGFEEELRYVKRKASASIPIDDAAALGELGLSFEAPDRLRVDDGSVIMPTLRYANEFGDLHLRGLTRTELTRRVRQYRDDFESDQCPSLNIADGDNFFFSRHDGRTYLCRFLVSRFVNSISEQPGVLDVWDLGWIQQLSH